MQQSWQFSSCGEVDALHFEPRGEKRRHRYEKQMKLALMIVRRVQNPACIIFNHQLLVGYTKIWPRPAYCIEYIILLNSIPLLHGQCRVPLGSGIHL